MNGRALLAALAVAGCAGSCRPRSAAPPARDLGAIREAMVRTQIAARGVSDPRVLAAMRSVPRERFVPPDVRSRAYEDVPLPIGSGQTISQPYVVALMAQLLEIRPGDRVLEIGTGSGYQAAVLARLAGEVDTIEIIPELSRRAESVMGSLGIHNVAFRVGDGWLGWPEKASFQRIIVTAAPRQLPPPLLAQLAPGGRMVIPVGDFAQELKVIEKDASGAVQEESVIPVRFVPMTGRAETPRP